MKLAMAKRSSAVLYLATVALTFMNTAFLRSQEKPKKNDIGPVTTATTIPNFAVASVRLNPSAGGRWKMQFTRDGYVAYGVTAQKLIQDAYGYYSNERIEGAPDWTTTLTYDVNAKVDDHDFAAYDALDLNERRPMLVALLAERFKLKTHYETKEAQGYALLVIGHGSELKETPPERIPPSASKGIQGLVTRSRRGQLTEEWASMHDFARFLSYQVHRPVVDQTGLPGRYDLKLDWTPENLLSVNKTDPASISSLGDAPDLFTALKEQLGLSLKSQKTAVEVLVIDHIEQPSAN